VPARVRQVQCVTFEMLVGIDNYEEQSAHNEEEGVPARMRQGQCVTCAMLVEIDNH